MGGLFFLYVNTTGFGIRGMSICGVPLRNGWALRGEKSSFPSIFALLMV